MSSGRIIERHPVIWALYHTSDGERSMAYQGARILCGRSDCEGFTDGVACPREGCDVHIESNQAERDEELRREMQERDEKRRLRRQVRLYEPDLRELADDD